MSDNHVPSHIARSQRAWASLLVAPLFLFVLLSCRTTSPVATKTAPSASSQASDSTAATDRAPTPDVLTLESPLPQDEAIRVGQLDNGLTYYVRANDQPEKRAELRLVVRAGSVLEDEDQLGLAHFVEHMAFNGTETYEKQALVEYLETIGMRFGADLNAYTSFDETVYQLQMPTDDLDVLDQGLVILSEWASSVSFESEEIEKERGVVIEEWRTGRGAQSRVRDQQFPIIFKGSRYAERLPIGTLESLQTFDPEALVRFYRDWYRPELMAVVAVGDFDVAHMEEQIRRRFAGLENPPDARERFEADVPPHDETLVSVVADPELTTSNISVMWKYPIEVEATVEDYRQSLVEMVFNSMLNARLDERTQEADPPYLGAYSSDQSFTRDLGMYNLGAAVEADGIEEGLQALLVESERARRFGFSQTELDRTLENFLRSYQRMYEERENRESSSLAAEYIRNFLEAEPIPGIEYEYALAERYLPTIEVEEVDQVAKRFFGEKNRVITATLPEKEGLEAPSEGAIVATFSEVASAELTRYVDRVREGGLLEAPSAGSIVERGRIDAVDASVWKLSNGARVILKVTDFKKDEIAFSAYSPGGDSLVDDDSYVSASLATEIVSLGGAGEFDLIELQKALAGKAAGASPYIGELMEGFSGGGSPQDIETLFQMVYLYATQPRCDETAFRSFVSRMKAVLENQQKQPEVVFGQEIARVMSQNHFRRRPLEESILGELDLDKACRAYKQRFADFSDFTFLFVGALDLEKIEPLVETYLASLPSTGRKETFRDVGVRSPSQTVERVVKRGLEPKSRVRLIFTGPYENPSIEENYRLNSMTTLLRTRLREALREDRGGTYGVGVSGDTSWDPVPEYRVSISFDCDPLQVDSLVEAVFDEIERLETELPSVEDLEKITEQQRREREVAVETNRYWLGSIGFYDRNGLDFQGIVDYEKRIDGLEREDIRDSARRYLTTDRYAKFVLLPEAEASDGEGSGAAVDG